SPTYTSPFDGPPELSTAMLVGFWNWPAPEPAMPAWQVVVQTWLTAVPSVTPYPQAAMKAPVAEHFCTRALPLSATYASPLVCSIATRTGVWNWPEPEPVLPKLPSGRNKALALVAPSASARAPTASATPLRRGEPKRTRPCLPRRTPFVRSTTGSET